MKKGCIYRCLVDAFYDYKLGTPEYRTTRFENEIIYKTSFQGNAIVNCTDYESSRTRLIGYKWFEPRRDERGDDPLRPLFYASVLLMR